MLTILMYLFKYHMSENCHVNTESEELSVQLEALGFEKNAIDQAFIWLDNLITQSECQIDTPSEDSIRVFTPYEHQYLNLECQSFILSLEKQQILNAHTREILIGQLLELDIDEIDTELIQWVTLMVLFHQEDQEKALSDMEFLVLNEDGDIH